MIEFTKDNVSLALDPKTKIRLEFNSPLFAEDVIEANKVFWFDLPMHPINVKALGHSNQPGASGKIQVYENYYLRIAGFIELKGSLIVRTVSDKFRVAFTTNGFSQYKETLLQDFDWGDDVALGDDTDEIVAFANAQILEEYPDVGFNFPMIYNPDFYGDKNGAYVGFLNYFEFIRRDVFAKNVKFNTGETDPQERPFNVENAYCLVPQFYLQEILSRLSDALGVDFTGELLTDSDFQQIMVYNGYSLDWNENEYYVKASEGDRDAILTNVLKFTNIEKGANAVFDGMEYTHNYYGYLSLYVRVRCTTETPGTVTLKLSIYNKTQGYELASEEVISEDTEEEEVLFIYFDITTGTAHLDHNDVIQFRITSDTSWVIAEMECNIVNMTETTLNRYSKTLSPANHVPRMKLNDFLKDLKTFFGMSLFVDHNTNNIQFSFIKDILQAAHSDITSLVAEGQKIEISEEKRFAIDFEWDGSDAATEDNFLNIDLYNDLGLFNNIKSAPYPTDPKDIIKSRVTNNIHKSDYTEELLERRWLFYSDIIQKQIVGTNGDEEEIKIAANPLLMYSWPYINRELEMEEEQFAVFPQIKKQGTSPQFISEEEEKIDVLRLFQWLGVITHEPNAKGITSITFPTASSSNYDINGNKVRNLSLFLEGADGLWDALIKQWYEWLVATEEITFTMGANFGVKNLMEFIQIICQPQSGATTSNIRWFMVESVKYLPKKLSIEISMNNIESAELIAVKQSMPASNVYGSSGSGS